MTTMQFNLYSSLPVTNIRILILGTRVSTAIDSLVNADDASFLLAIKEVHNNEKLGTMSKVYIP